MANSSSTVCIIVVLLVCSAACSAESRNAATAPPTVVDANAFVQSGNTYRQLVKANLVWKVPPTAECASARARLEMLATPSSLIDAALVHPQLLIEMIQRAEENTYTQLHTFSMILYEAVRARCFNLKK